MPRKNIKSRTNMKSWCIAVEKWIIFLILSIVSLNSASAITFTGNIDHIWNMTADNTQIVSDLDGDGLDDLLTYTVNGNSLTSYAKKGSTGAQLWSDTITWDGPTDSIYLIPVGDLNGDGLTDIVIKTVLFRDNKYYSNLRAEVGKDGTPLWQETLFGDQFFNTHILDVQAAGDLNADKKDDVYVSIYDGNLLTVKALNGFDGSQIWQIGPTNENIAVRPAGDTNGDKKNDTLSNIYNYDTKMHTVRISSGDDYNAEKWKTSSFDDIFYGEPVVDLDGNKLNEVLIYDNEYDLNPTVSRILLKSGYKGADLWNYTVKNGSIEVKSIMNLNGHTINDFLLLLTSNDNGFPAKMVKLLNGDYGTLIWSDYIWKGDLGIYPVKDINKDGYNDLVISYQDADTNTEIIRARAGKNGSLIWEESLGSTKHLFKVVEINSNDVVESIGCPNCDDPNLIEAKNGTTGNIIWQDSISTNGYIDTHAAGDLKGDKGNDLVLHIADANTYIVKAKEGTDGTDLWGVSSNNDQFIYPNYIIKDLTGGGISDVLINDPSNENYLVSYKNAGDANGDGVITSSDALLYLRSSVGQNISPYHLDISDDVTCDGKITAGDALLVLRKAVGQNVNLICIA